MAIRGERFELDLDPEDAFARSQGQQEPSSSPSSPSSPSSQAPLGFDFVKDVLEHAPDASAPPPEPPRPRQNTSTGFPAHRKRESRFKRARDGPEASSDTAVRDGKKESISGGNAARGTYLNRLSSATEDEKRDIDRTTTQMLANMPPDELEEARRQLSDDPSFAAIRRLLNRGTIDSDTGLPPTDSKTLDQPRTGNESEAEDTKEATNKKPAAAKKVSFAKETEKRGEDDFTVPPSAKPAGVPIFSPADIKPVSTSSSFRTPFYRSKYAQDDSNSASSLSSLPTAPQQPIRTEPSKPTTAAHPSPSVPFIKSSAPSLDPNSETFLSDLHDTYYPDLPSDPTRMAWMAPIEQESVPQISNTVPTVTTTDLSDPSQSQLSSSAMHTIIDPGTPPSHLRFDMRGSIVSASRGAKIPVTKGLHHHGRDPGAAGYTIGELSIYSRSTLAAQRCFAYMLLGRMLFRLGVGEFRLDGRRRNAVGQGDDSNGAGYGNARTDPEPGDGRNPAWDDLPPDPREDGLWREVQRGHVLDQMMNEAARQPGTGSESARVWALEALWLWRKGGGKGLEDTEDAEGDIMGDAAAQILEEGLN